MSVNTVEAMLIKHACARTLPAPCAYPTSQDEKPTYFVGNVKGKTKRFCGDELKQSCGPNPGDWSVMSTKLESGHIIYG
eukprot:4823822-Pleurochrysis_carterae.AAC.1